MEPSNFDRAIKDALDRQLVVADHGGKERVWNRVEQQLHREPALRWWKLAALILLLLLPSAGLWMQNRKQASTIERLSQNLDVLKGKPQNQTASVEIPKVAQPIVVHDTVIRHQPAVVYTKTDTVTQIQIVTDTVVIYRQIEMAAEPERGDMVLPDILQESQRAEFLLDPADMKRTRKRPDKAFTFRFSLGGQPVSSVSPVGIQTRL